VSDRQKKSTRTVLSEEIMGQKLTRGQIQDLVGKFALENPRYRRALLENPKSLLERQLNTSLGPIQVRAVLDSADTVHIVVPYVPMDGELSDADLEQIAGGKQFIEAECKVYGSASNTLMQLNL
jgi:hypothetical protein